MRFSSKNSTNSRNGFSGESTTAVRRLNVFRKEKLSRLGISLLKTFFSTMPNVSGGDILVVILGFIIKSCPQHSFRYPGKLFETIKQPKKKKKNQKKEILCYMLREFRISTCETSISTFCETFQQLKDPGKAKKTLSGISASFFFFFFLNPDFESEP